MKRINLVACLLSLASSTGAFAQSTQQDPLKTTTGNEIGITLSAYKYNEPTLGDSQSAFPMVGINYTGTYAFGNDIFLKADGRYANGSSSYSGSGSKSGNPNWYYDLRALVGYDFKVDSYVLSPYIGYGYRYLWNDLTGTTSTGANGYTRESNYYYIPLGITHKINLGEPNRNLETNVEYDYLIQGKQISGAVGSIPQSNNTQNSGYGARISSMYQMGDWAFGPYLTYWNIQASNWVRSGNYLVQEPSNSTTEAGLKATYKF